MNQYQLDANARQIAAVFTASMGQDIWEEGTVNALSPAPVIVSGPTGKRSIRPYFWGFPPPPGGEVPVLTVRNLESPFWIGNLRHIGLRCLVPATSFTLRGKGKAIECRLKSEPLFAFAGIWRDTTDYPAFAIITCAPNVVLEDKGTVSMPVILQRDDWGKWLSQDWRKACQLVDALPSQLMSFNV